MNKMHIKAGMTLHSMGGTVAISAPAVRKEASKTLEMRIEMAEQAKQREPKLEWNPFTHKFEWR